MPGIGIAGISQGGNRPIIEDKMEARLEMDDLGAAAAIFGKHDENLVLIEKSLGVKMVARGEELIVSGAAHQVQKAKEVMEQLQKFYRAGNGLTLQEINYILQAVQDGNFPALEGLVRDVVCITPQGKKIKPKTRGQQLYVSALRQHDLVFAVGPAGTGKTYLAVVMAVQLLKARKVNRIVLTRPAVEAGEKLGFLPGDLQEKVDPYLRPLYDGLYDVLGFDQTQKHLERRVIEIAPLAYMRGRTLDDSFIILDEAQNTTQEQMKMFLTRLGVGSSAVITGDITQVDLPKGQQSGLMQAMRILSGLEGIAFHYFTEVDIVRHPLVQRIVQAYEKNDTSDDG